MKGPRFESGRRLGWVGSIAHTGDIDALGDRAHALLTATFPVVLLTPEDVDTAAELSVDYRPPGS